MLSFTVLSRDPGSTARTGRLTLNHGTVATPCFMPVGTNATVKAVTNDNLEAMGLSLILANTYHLYLRPGMEVMGAAGGLHKFMGWRGNILTDSGGYQIFSLSPFRKVEEGGINFKSHIDGSAHRLGPRDVVEIERILGSDVLMPLDYCTPPGINHDEALTAMRLTMLWLSESKKSWVEIAGSTRGDLFGIVQGNFFSDLRAECAQRSIEMDLPGYAIGGLSVGEDFNLYRDFLHATALLLPSAKPRYVMGIGTPEYILEAVEAGVDLFDCVLPTRTARNARVFTRDGPLSLRAEKNRLDFRPLDGECRCQTCRNHTRGYLRHLFKAGEIQAAVLATHHNLHFTQDMMRGVRDSIERGSFKRFKREFLNQYAGGVHE